MLGGETELVGRRHLRQQRIDARPSLSCCLSQAESKPTQEMIPVGRLPYAAEGGHETVVKLLKTGKADDNCL